MRQFTQKLSILLLVLLCSLGMVNAQTLNEGFEDADFPPEGWSVIHVTGGSVWQRVAWGSSYAHTGNACVYVNYDYTGGHNNYLVTPQLTPQSGESLSFYVKTDNYTGTTLTVELSTTDAQQSSFTTVLATYATGSSLKSWTNKTIDLSAYAGQSVYIAFHVVDDNGAAVYLDDISGVTAVMPSCPKQKNLAAANVTAHTADLSWTAVEGQTQWEIQYRVFGTEEWTAVAGQVSTNPYTLSNLAANTHYEVQVRAYCSAEEQSDWSSSVNFTTPPTCITPTGVTVVDSTITTSTAVVKWTAGNDETQWQVRYTCDWSNYDTILVSANTYTLTGLTQNKQYSVSVRAYCAEDDQSEWTYGTSFTTLPTCPKPQNLSVTEVTVSSVTLTWTAGGAETAWTINYRQSGTAEWTSIQVTSNPATVSSLQPDVNYEFQVAADCSDEDQSDFTYSSYAFTGYCVPSPGSVDGNGIIDIAFEGVSQTAAQHTHEWPVYVNNSSVAYSIPVGQTASIDITYFTGYTYGTVIWVDWNNNLTFEPTEVVYYGTSTNAKPTVLNCTFVIPAETALGNYRMRIAGADSYFESAIANEDFSSADPCASMSYLTIEDYTLTVTAVPTCLKPLNLMVVDSMMTSTTATVVWNAAEATAWELQYRQAGAEEWTMVEGQLTDSVYTLTGLQPATTYQVQVRAYCSAEEQSDWSALASFITECAAITALPWSEDFSGTYAANSLPLCWQKISGSSYPYVSSNQLNFYGGGTTSEQIAVLPEMQSDVNRLTIQFDYKASVSSSYSTYGDLVLGYMTDPADATTFVALASLDQESNMTNKELTLGAAPADAHYIAFRYAGGSSNYGSAYVDNIVLTVTPSCVPLQKVAVSGITRREMQINLFPKAGQTPSNIDLVISTAELDDAALESAEKIQVTDTLIYRATQLTRNTTYHIYARVNCGAEDGASAWVSTSATTMDLYYSEVANIPATANAASSYAPIYGLYADSKQHTQSIYPAEMLTELVGKTITGLTYYVTSGSNAGKWDNTTFNVGLAITSNSELSSAFDETELTICYSGTVVANTADNMVIEFTTPFTYTGGNLLIDINQPIASGYTSVSFSAQTTTTNASRYGYGTNGGTALKQLPMAGFHYDMALDACPAVTDVAVSDITTNTAVVRWTASAGDYANTCDVLVSTAEVNDFTDVIPTYMGITVDSCLLNGLDAYTDYYVYVLCHCDAEGQNDGNSVWAPVTFKTMADCRIVNDINVVITGKTTATVTWTEGEEGQTFQYVLSTTQLDADALETATVSGTSDTTMVELTGMLTNTTYYLYVAGVCGESAHSPYVAAAPFTTPKACPAVVNVTASNIAFNAVTISWEKGVYGEETEWEVGVVGYEANARTATSNSIVYFGLNEFTAYHMYVLAVCGDNEKSDTAYVSFVTLTQSNEAVVGDATITNGYIPSAQYFNTSLAEMIYTPEEIGKAGSITSIAFNSTTTNTKSRNIKIYLLHTAKSTFDANNDWVTVASSDLVYDGTTSFATGWNSFDLNAPFVYNGSDNLLIVVDDNSSSYASDKAFKGWYAADDNTLYQYSDDTNLDPTSALTANGTRTGFKPQLKLNFEAAACESVTRLAVKDLAVNSATVSWYPGGSETQWATYLSTTEVTDWTGITPDTVNDVQVSLTALATDADYYYYVRALCSETEYSNWSSVHFATKATVHAPAGLVMDEILANQATIAWYDTDSIASGNYTVAYGEAATFDLNDPATYLTVTVDTLAATITGLNPQTVYTAAVRSNGEMTSRWSNTIDFRTACAAMTVPAQFNFDDATNYMPLYDYVTSYGEYHYTLEDCWTEGKDKRSSSSYYGFRIIENNTTSEYAQGNAGLYLYQYTYYLDSAWVAMPMMDESVDMDEVQLNFDVRALYTRVSDGAISSNYSSDTYSHAIKVGLTDDPANLTDFYLLREYVLDPVDYGTEPDVNNFWNTVRVPLEEGHGRYIVFLSDYQKDNYLYIDNVTVDALPACVDPQHLAVVPDVTEATVTWTSTASEFNVVLYKDGEEVDTYTATTNSITLTGLQSGTRYRVAVQAVCSPTETSEFNRIDFTTLYGLPFAEDFNSCSSGVPVDWTRLSGDLYNKPATTTSGWSSTTYACGTMDTHVYNNVYYGYKYAMVTPEISFNVPAGFGVTMSMDMALTTSSSGTTAPSASATTNKKFQIVVSTDGGTTWGDTALVWGTDTDNMGTFASISNNVTRYTFDLTPFAGQSVMIAFSAEDYSGNYSSSYINIDNLEIRGFNASCLGVDSVSVSNVGFTTATVNWIYKAGDNNAVVALGTTPEYDEESVVFTDTVNGANQYALNFAMQSNSTYYIYVNQLCGDGQESGWSQGTAFSTPVGLPYIEDFENGLPATWTIYQTSLSGVQGDAALVEVASGVDKTWGVDTKTYGLPTGKSLNGELYSTTNYGNQAWAVTPAINLTEVTSGIGFNFDMAFTNYNNGSAPGSVSSQSVYMLVEVDGAWTAANTWKWSDADDQAYARLSDVALTGTHYTFNFSQFAGHNIRIAFYKEATAGDNRVFIDNINLDFADVNNYSEDVCRGAIFDKHGFDQASSEEEGSFHFEQYVAAAEGAAQQFNSFDLNVWYSEFTEIFEDVYVGDHYVLAPWFDLIVQPGDEEAYGVEEISSHGCDSVILLTLTISTADTLVTNDTINLGETYVWGDTVYTETGTYTYNEYTALGGVMHVNILNLYVYAPVTYEYFVKVTEAPADGNWEGEYLAVYEAASLAFNTALETLDAVDNGQAVNILYNADSVAMIAATDANRAMQITISQYTEEEASYLNLRAANGLYFGALAYTGGPANKITADADSTIFRCYADVVDNEAHLYSTVGTTDEILMYNAGADQNRFRFYKTANQQPVVLYRLTAVSEEDVPTVLGQISGDTDVEVLKVILNDRLYIMRNNVWYDAAGIRVADPR